MLLFQFEGVAEQWLSNDDWANFRSWAGHPDVRRGHRRPGANGSLTPRSTGTGPTSPPRPWSAPAWSCRRRRSPTMGVWGTGDFALTEVQMTGLAAHVTGSWRYERLDGVAHWMQLEEPEKVNELLLDFLPT